jgi:putative tryptophan/tyrosine transport system substrate-binding protein
VKRREFLAGLGGVAAAWPILARAQQPAMPVIGFLHPASPDGYTDRVRGFRQGLKETGFVEGENVAIEYRWAEDRVDRLPTLVADLVRRRVAAIAKRRPRQSPSSSSLTKTRSGSVLSRASRGRAAT